MRTNPLLLGEEGIAPVFANVARVPLTPNTRLDPRSARLSEPVRDRALEVDEYADSVLPNDFERRARLGRTRGTDPVSLAEQRQHAEEERREQQALAAATYTRYQQIVADLDRQIAVTERDLAGLRESLSRIEAERAELAPLIARQREVLAAAQDVLSQREQAFTTQQNVVREQEATVDALKVQQAVKQEAVTVATANEQAASAELEQAKQTTQEKTELKTLTEQDVQTVKDKYEAESKTTLKDDMGREIYRKVDAEGKPTLDAEGKAILVSPAGNVLSREEVKSLESHYGPDFRDKVALYDKQKMDSSTHAAFHAMEADFGAKNQLETAKKDEAQAQVKWEQSAEALKFAQGELTALNEKLATETEKLKVEQTKLAEERTKLEEQRKVVANEKEKLEQLEAKDRELAKQQADVKAQIDAKAKELGDLKTSADRLKDPDYARKVQSGEISYNQVIQDLPASQRERMMAQYPEPKAAPTLLPDTNPAAQRVVSTTPPTPAPTKPESGVTAASTLGDGPKSLQDTGKAQLAFNTAAPDSPAKPEASPSAPKPEEEKKEEEKKLVVSTSAPAPAAPAVA
jgi:hypothetical protein